MSAPILACREAELSVSLRFSGATPFQRLSSMADFRDLVGGGYSPVRPGFGSAAGPPHRPKIDIYARAQRWVPKNAVTNMTVMSKIVSKSLSNSLLQHLSLRYSDGVPA
jgi:hypothetical protein